GPEMQPFWDIMDRELEREQDRILQAKTLAETGLSADAYVVRAILSVQGLAEKDHGAAVTQAKKVVDLIEAEQRTKGWDGKKTSNGYNLASQFLEKLAPNTASPLRFQPASAVTEVYGSIQSRDACPPGVMALQLELMTEPDQRRFAHLAWPEAYGWATTLTQDFSAAAGWVDARSAAASLARPFEPTLDRGSQQLAVLSYYHTAHQVPGWMLRRAQVALAEDEARRPLAEALEVALTLAEVNGFGADPLPVGSPWPEAALPVRQRLLSWMADESVNPLVRCALAAFASRSCANLDGSAEVTLAAMDLACQSLEQAWPVTGYAWLGTVRAFNRLDPTQPSWKSMATRYLTAYTQRASRDSEPRERGRGFWPIRTSVVTGLETALLLGDEARLSAWVQRFGKDFETNVGALQLLIRHRQPTYAKAIAEKILTRCDGANYNSGLHQAYRASDEEALTDVLKSFRTPLSQLLARIAVAGAPRDSFLIGHGAGGVVPHNERIAAVARDVAIFGMKTPEPTDHLFQHCDSAAGGMIEMADWAAHHSGKDPQERARALLGFSKYSSTPYRYLAAEPLKQLYTEGKIEAWKAMIDPLAKQFGEDKLKRSWAVHGVGLCLKDTAMLWARGRPVQELLPAADAALALVEKNDYHSAWGGAVNSLMFAQAIYALNDRPLPQSEALDAAVKICRGSVQKAEDLDNLVFSLCSGDANNTCSRPLEERMRLVKLLMSSNFVGTETVQRLPSPLAWMRARGVLTGDEIRAQAVPLAQLWGQTKQLPDLIGILLEKQPMAEVVQLLAPAVRDHTTDGTAGQLRRVLLAACALEVGDRKLAQEMLSFAKPTVEAWQKRDARLKTEVKKPTPSKAEIESVNAWLWPAVDAGYQWVEKQLGETAR
ncbi:MAG: hypothetical protein KDK99_11605, partial [Verrucomicrobiales bacterium]|nr:hypothetical protein [Verrucomicrobiales bacterium]